MYYTPILYICQLYLKIPEPNELGLFETPRVRTPISKEAEEPVNFSASYLVQL